LQPLVELDLVNLAHTAYIELEDLTEIAQKSSNTMTIRSNLIVPMNGALTNATLLQ
jgi:hypothetical protein